MAIWELLAMRFIEAGCEVILHCNGTLSERTQVAQPAGEMSDIAQKRAIRAVKMRKTPDMIDIAVLDAKLKALLSGGALAQ